MNLRRLHYKGSSVGIGTYNWMVKPISLEYWEANSRLATKVGLPG